MGPNGEPLVRLLDSLPSGTDMEKTAGVHPEILAYKQQLEPEPGKTYVHILALGAGDYYGANLNNDHFPWSGLQHDHTKTAHPYMHGHKTFLNAHAFAHHVNKDPEKAYGDVLISVLNHKMKRVELIVAIDEEKCIRNGGQRTLEKIKAGEYPSTSMGCRVPFDVCSICGHKAKYRSEYCDHMRNDAGKIMADGRKVFVYNPYPRFFDISFVFIGADRTSFVLEKVAHAQQPDMKKEAVINAIKGLNWTLQGAGKRALAGGAMGAVTGAMQSADGSRDRGLIRGAMGGALLGGFGGNLFRSGVTGTAALGMMGGQMGAIQPAPPAQTSSLQMNKVAADGGLGRSLRKSSGTVKPYMGLRVKKKVARQSRLRARPLTFAKLRANAKRSAASRNINFALKPLPQITIDVPGGFLQKKVKEDEHMDIIKSAELKSATVTKLSDIFKDVQSAPMGKAVQMSVGSEPDMSCGQLDRISAQPDLGSALSGMASAGIVLKPREFQRVVLIRSGLRDMADRMDAQGAVFPERAPVVRSMRIVIRPSEQAAIPNGILDLVRNIMSQRSSLTPLMLRRGSMNSAPTPTVTRIRVGAIPVLDKVASFYNAYREDVLLQAEDMIKVGMHTPALMKIVSNARGIDDYEGPAFNAMAQIPLAYFSHAYWNRCCCDRALSDKQFAEKFTEDNPDIAKFIARQVATSQRID